MNKTTTALKLAEEALDKAESVYEAVRTHPIAIQQVQKALAAIREALAEPDWYEEAMRLGGLNAKHVGELKQLRAEPVKCPQNCGTGYCSCIECVMEPVSIPEHITCPFCESDHVPDWLHDLKLDAKAIRARGEK